MSHSAALSVNSSLLFLNLNINTIKYNWKAEHKGLHENELAFILCSLMLCPLSLCSFSHYVAAKEAWWKRSGLHSFWHLDLWIFLIVHWSLTCNLAWLISLVFVLIFILADLLLVPYAENCMSPIITASDPLANLYLRQATTVYSNCSGISSPATYQNQGIW